MTEVTVGVPYRISFFGGGSDYEAWYSKHKGAVLTSTINAFCKVKVRPIPICSEYKFRLVYSKIESINCIEDIEHPAIKAVLKYFNIKEGLEIIHIGDLPARSGLGSSSAFTVALIRAIHQFYNNNPTANEVAKQAIHIEHHVIKECVGIQDQIETAYTGFNKIDFFNDGDFKVTPISLSAARQDELNAHLLLFFTGITRNAPTIAKTQIENIKNKDCNIHKLVDMVSEGIEILQSDSDICRFGTLLEDAWQIKRKISNTVSNKYIDELYHKAIHAGAIGGKILGAGGGGFLLMFAKPKYSQSIIQALSQDTVQVPFTFYQKTAENILQTTHEVEVA